MKKGYLIGQITITEPKKYQQYASEIEYIIKRFGGRYLIRGGEQIIAEGTPQEIRESDTVKKAYLGEEAGEIQAQAGERMTSSLQGDQGGQDG